MQTGKQKKTPKPKDWLKVTVSDRKGKSSISCKHNLISDCFKVPSWIFSILNIELRKFGLLFLPSTPTSQKNRLPHLHFNGAQPWAPFKSSERHFIPSAPPPSEQTSLRHVLLLVFRSDSQSDHFLALRVAGADRVQLPGW